MWFEIDIYFEVPSMSIERQDQTENNGKKGFHLCEILTRYSQKSQNVNF